MLSDTHERHRGIDVPPGDILLCAGDLLTINRHFTTEYSLTKLEDIANWMRALPHTHKVFIGGNHDRALEVLGKAKVDALFHGCTYLEDSMVALPVGSNRQVCVWGSPYSRGSSENSAFQSRPAERLALVPQSMDVLLTHGPLQKKEWDKLKPCIHVCGHIHRLYGVTHDRGCLRVNAAIMDGSYNPSHRPIVVDVSFCN